jgi:hypothetical protein
MWFSALDKKRGWSVKRTNTAVAQNWNIADKIVNNFIHNNIGNLCLSLLYCVK